MAFQDLTWRTYEPKTSNRFIFSMGAAGPPSYLVTSAQRPQVDFGDIVINHINIQRKFKGKATWQDMEITLNDPITAEGAAQVYLWLREHHDAETGIDGYASDYKKQLRLDALGPDGEVVETWTLYGAFIGSVNFGATAFDWDSEDILKVSITLKYDWAKLERPEA